MTGWLYARDVQADLGVCRATACRILRRIPGAELMYVYENRTGERWRISSEKYQHWKAQRSKMSG